MAVDPQFEARLSQFIDRQLDVTNKNYTMKEIAGIEQKIDRLTDLVSLSLLETQTKSLFIPDGDGLDRFKNGILVDLNQPVQQFELQLCFGQNPLPKTPAQLLQE